jgi:signal transduction histidine kinase
MGPTVALFVSILLLAAPAGAEVQPAKDTLVTADSTDVWPLAFSGEKGQPSGNIQLTPEEEAWRRNHSTIKVGMSPVIPPLKFSEHGVIKGIEPDYLTILSEITGLQFEYVINEFSTMDAKVKSGEIDMFISFYIPERLAYMTFSEPLMEFKQVIIARSDAPFMSGIGSLKGKKVATIKGVKLYEKLLGPYPEIETVRVGNSEEMFEAVASFKADALITRTYTAGYVMQNYPNLKITGVADLPPEPYLYAVRKDFPELVAILNKAIASITRDQRDAIAQKWFSFRIEYQPNWGEILKWALAIGGVFVTLLVFSLIWNRRLSREIAKRREAEAASRLFTEELARSNVDLQQFAYVASHDLQEPLRMISSYLQLIERRYKDKLDDDANTFIHYAVDGANRMQALIGGLLEFSRVRTQGKAFATVDIGEVVNNVCRDLQPLIVESGATIRYDRMPIIIGDEAQITRLFQNLLQNGLKFRREGIPPVIEIRAETKAGEMVFSVHDNGIGIEPQYFDRIFTIFQRLHTREEYPGTGIGLSICKRIVERHGGSIWLESTPGAGTSLYFSIPGGLNV